MFLLKHFEALRREVHVADLHLEHISILKAEVILGQYEHVENFQDIHHIVSVKWKRLGRSGAENSIVSGACFPLKCDVVFGQDRGPSRLPR